MESARNNGFTVRFSCLREKNLWPQLCQFAFLVVLDDYLDVEEREKFSVSTQVHRLWLMEVSHDWTWQWDSSGRIGRTMPPDTSCRVTYELSQKLRQNTARQNTKTKYWTKDQTRHSCLTTATKLQHQQRDLVVLVINLKTKEMID